MHIQNDITDMKLTLLSYRKVKYFFSPKFLHQLMECCWTRV